MVPYVCFGWRDLYWERKIFEFIFTLIGGRDRLGEAMKPLSSEANLSGSCVPLKDSMNEIKLMYIFEVEVEGEVILALI